MKRYMAIGIMTLWACAEVLFGGHKVTIKVSCNGGPVHVTERHYDWKDTLTSEKEWYQESWD